jgi:hypothetical protein
MSRHNFVIIVRKLINYKQILSLMTFLLFLHLVFVIIKGAFVDGRSLKVYVHNFVARPMGGAL